MNTINFLFARLHKIVAASLLLFVVSKTNAQDAGSKDYKFKIGVTYNVSSAMKGNMNTMRMWFSENGYSGVEAGGNNAIFVVFDMQSQKMYTIMEAQKMMMAMDMKSLQQHIPDAKQQKIDTAISNAEFTKTGVTEKIFGYNCDQYKVTSSNSEALLWVTTELGSGFTDISKSLMMAINRGKQGSAALPDTKGAFNGVMLKLVATDLSTKKVTTIEATDVNKDGKEINASDYKVMNMPAGMGNMMQ